MSKLFYLLLFITLLLMTHICDAHVHQSSQTKLQILPNGYFTISLQTDLLRVLQQHLIDQKRGTDDAALIKQMQEMTITEQLKFLSEVKNYIKDHTLIRFDQKIAIIKSIIGPSLAEVKQLVNTPAGNQGYPIIFIGTGKISTDSASVTIQLPEFFGDTLLSVAKPSQMFVSQGQESNRINIAQSTMLTPQLYPFISTAITYSYQGFIHIIPKGFDHILFVLALFLLTAKFSTLLWQVSAFTLAHTITLALGIFGLVNISASIIEPLIALSIAYVAIENIFASKLKKWRIIVIFIFGLLHGLGFASVLLELGLAPDQYIVSLISFNVGVEIAQITVLLLALFCLYRFQQKYWYRQRIIQPFSLIIASVGIYWFIERII